MDENNIFFPYKNWVKAKKKKIKVLRRRCFATYVSKEINGRASAHFLTPKTNRFHLKLWRLRMLHM